MLQGQNLILIVEATSTSRIKTTHTENLLIDITPPEASISQLNSVNISQLNTSNHTVIFFDISSDIQDVCYLIERQCVNGVKPMYTTSKSNIITQ